MAWRNVVVTRHCKISTKMRLLVIQTDDDVCQLPMDDIGMLMIETDTGGNHDMCDSRIC